MNHAFRSVKRPVWVIDKLSRPSLPEPTGKTGGSMKYLFPYLALLTFGLAFAAGGSHEPSWVGHDAVAAALVKGAAIASATIIESPEPGGSMPAKWKFTTKRQASST